MNSRKAPGWPWHAAVLIAGTLSLSAKAAAPSVERAVAVDAGVASAREDVLALLEQQRQAWNRGDLEAFCAVYADSALFLSPSGLTQGRAQVLARYQKRYPDKKAMGTLSFEVLEVRSAPGAVSIAARWSLRAGDGKPSSGHTLIVFHQQPSGWQLVQDASM